MSVKNNWKFWETPMIKKIKDKRSKIVLAKDDEDDIDIALRAFKKSELSKKVYVVRKCQ